MIPIDSKYDVIRLIHTMYDSFAKQTHQVQLKIRHSIKLDWNRK
jgi:hypothetical protein